MSIHPDDLGTHPYCLNCKGTGREPNAQFRCACRWEGSPVREAAEKNALAQAKPKAEDTGFEKESFQSVIESALYTCDNIAGDIRFGAQQELFKRLKLIVPEPEWSKKHATKKKQVQVEDTVAKCINNHGGFRHGNWPGFCPQCEEALKAVIGEPPSRQDSLNAASSLLDVIQKFWPEVVPDDDYSCE